MVPPGSRLVALLRLVDRIPTPPASARRRCRPPVYSDRLFLKAPVVMLVRHLHRVHELLAALADPRPRCSRCARC
jgi:hypothetical protein